MYKHILVPTDGSPLALKAAKEAASLAAQLNAKLTAVYVTEGFNPPMSAESMLPGHMTTLQAAYRKSSEHEAQKALGKIANYAAEQKIECETVHVDGTSPWDGIVKTAQKRKCDLVVMASHGHGSFAGLVLGSETTKVLAKCKTPVLVCR
jgi:nucleotide-binding universal stress UspA family protein